MHWQECRHRGSLVHSWCEWTLAQLFLALLSWIKHVHTLGPGSSTPDVYPRSMIIQVTKRQVRKCLSVIYLLRCEIRGRLGTP